MDPITLRFSDRALEDAFIAERVKTIGYSHRMPFVVLQGALFTSWLMCGLNEAAALALAFLGGSWVVHQYWVLSVQNRARVYKMTCQLQGICMFSLLGYYCLCAEVHPPLQGSQFRVEVVIDAGCTMLGCLVVHIAHMPPENKFWTCLLPVLAHIFKPVWNIGDGTEINLWIGATLMGTSIGYILESSLRSLYLTQVRESRHAAANRAADSRLNHVIKGLCGSASGLISTALVDESQARLLSEHAILQLNEAVEWCHQRQLFIQLETGSYKSLKVDCAVGKLLERLVEPVHGRLEGPVALKARVDEGVLRLVVAEAISNATKYRRPGTTIIVKLELFDGKLRISFENINAAGVRRLTEQECAEVFLPGFRVHSVSVTSDGLGLDTVHTATMAAGGAAWLSCHSDGSDCTVFHFELPAIQLPDDRAPGGSAVQHSCATRVQAINSPDAPLRCIGVDDCRFQRALHELLFKNFLHADARSHSIGATKEEQLAFVDVVLGRLTAQLHPVAPKDAVQMDIAIIDQNLTVDNMPHLLGHDLAEQLRQEGFVGVACIFSGSSDDELQDIRTKPGVDMVLSKCTPLPEVTMLLREAFGAKKLAQAC